MDIEKFNYNLPKELIAQYPLKRGHDKLITIDRSKGKIYHRNFEDIIEYLREDDLIVLNNTKVIQARLIGRKESGGKVEILLLKSITNDRWNCLVKASKKPKPGQYIFFDKNVVGKIESYDDDWYEISFSDPDKVVLIGQIPLPPYIERLPEDIDKDSYQTVYASHDGSVAAPTAGLHFTPDYLDKIKSRGIEQVFITLHIGTGTFVPVRTKRIEDHKMHSEEFLVSSDAAMAINNAIAQDRRIVAVGTTTTRVLEHLMMQSGKIIAGTGNTNLFIYEGFSFKCVRALLTNFHLPCSTLLILVTAFGGYELIINAYESAIERKYRFFSYGDAMFIF